MPTLIVRTYTEAQAYSVVHQTMQAHCHRRPSGPDELWLMAHQPVYTLGQAGKKEHILDAGNIPVVQSDRGGQVTYHGPGQLMAYTLFNLKRLGIGVRRMVVQLEQSVIECLQDLGIHACGRRDAPGVYVDDAKIASIGLRIRHGHSYHGLALNVNMDLQPFKGINPCGFKQLKMVQCADFVPNIGMARLENLLTKSIGNVFAYDHIKYLDEQPSLIVEDNDISTTL